ncbi:hypothetical protein [Moraxella lacunata]
MVVPATVVIQTRGKPCYNQNVPNSAKCTKVVTQALPNVVTLLHLVRLV